LVLQAPQMPQIVAVELTLVVIYTISRSKAQEIGLLLDLVADS
jgi:hypothetical protein